MRREYEYSKEMNADDEVIFPAIYSCVLCIESSSRKQRISSVVKCKICFNIYGSYNQLINMNYSVVVHYLHK